VLKHEPREAGAIQLLIPPSRSVAAVRAAFSHVDDCLRRGDFDTARQFADKFLLSANQYREHASVLVRELFRLRRARRQQT
jgi:hypothetical protein